MKIEQWDAFDKVDDEYVDRTKTGAYASILVTAIVLLLSTAEISRFLSPKHSYKYTVDGAIRQQVTVGMDVTVAMKCDFLTVHTNDVSGTTERVDQDMDKVPTMFSTAGVYLDGHKPNYQISGSSPIDNINVEYGGGVNRENPVDADVSDACRIRGDVELNKVEGSIQITASGHSYSGAHTPHDAINFTHRIDSFTFDKDTSTKNILLANPLSKSFKISHTRVEYYQYFLSVVRTIIKTSNKQIMTNQYGVTDHKKIFETQEDGISGIFFRYDFEPVAIQITTEREESIPRFLVRMAGIIGGIYVSTGLVHSLVNFAIRTLESTQRGRSVRM